MLLGPRPAGNGSSQGHPTCTNETECPVLFQQRQLFLIYDLKYLNRLFGKSAHQEAALMWHLFLPLYHIPWGLILPVALLLPEPTPVFQLTCSRWAAEWGGHWQKQMCLFTGDKNAALVQMATPQGVLRSLTLLSHYTDLHIAGRTFFL